MDRDAAGGRRRRRRITYMSILGIMLLLHALAWSSERFCDWYAVHVFRIWVETYGRAMGMVPFSVGEVLIWLGLGFGLLGGVLGLIWLAGRMPGFGEGQSPANVRGGARRKPGAWTSVRPKRRTKGSERISASPGGCRPEHLGALRSFCRTYCTAAMWVLLTAFALMTLNCAILYHTSGFGEQYLEAAAAEYGLEELEALRNFVVGQCNALCCRIPRNEDGSLSYGGDMTEAAREAMGKLGEAYGQLGGFYPAPKPLRCSDFLSRRYIAGCFYPFSMEANYNDVMYVMNMPSTMCHELAHLKGFIREDEANLIGYLACVQSEDIYFRYSGYLSVLYYIDNDYREAVGLERYLAAEPILPQVREDNVFLTEKERARVEETASMGTEVVDAVSDRIADVRLKLNGVEDGVVSYSNVVGLLLRYYDVWGY